MENLYTFNNQVYVVKNEFISIIKDLTTDEIMVSDISLPYKADKMFLFNDSFLYKFENNIYKFDLNSEINELLFENINSFFHFYNGNFYFVTNKEYNLIIKKVNLITKESTETVYEVKSILTTEIDENNLLLIDEWDLENETNSEELFVKGFAINEDNFAAICGKYLVFANLKWEHSKAIEVNMFYKMDVDVFIESNSVIINGKDDQFSLSVFVPHISFNREKRKGSIEKIQVKVIKKGFDNVSPLFSKDSMFWFGLDGEKTYYPIILDLKKWEPIAVFDDPFEKGKEPLICANEDFSKLFLLTKENILIEYLWDKNGIIKDFEINLNE